MLRDRGRAIGLDLGDGKSRADEIVEFGEERIVSAGRLGTAFDDVPGDNSTRECIDVFRSPTEVGGGGTDDHRCVGDSPGHDDIGSGVEAPRNAPRTEIRVGGQRARVGLETELVDASEEIVAFDMGDAW